MGISLIVLSGSAHKDRLKQCPVRMPLLVYGRCPIVKASEVGLCGPHSVATLDTDANEQLIPSAPVTHFCIRKIMRQKSQKYLNVL